MILKRIIFENKLSSVILLVVFPLRHKTFSWFFINNEKKDLPWRTSDSRTVGAPFLYEVVTMCLSFNLFYSLRIYTYSDWIMYIGINYTYKHESQPADGETASWTFYCRHYNSQPSVFLVLEYQRHYLLYWRRKIEFYSQEGFKLL